MAKRGLDYIQEYNSDDEQKNEQNIKSTKYTNNVLGFVDAIITLETNDKNNIKPIVDMEYVNSLKNYIIESAKPVDNVKYLTAVDTISTTIDAVSTDKYNMIKFIQNSINENPLSKYTIVEQNYNDIPSVKHFNTYLYKKDNIYYTIKKIPLRYTINLLILREFIKYKLVVDKKLLSPDLIANEFKQLITFSVVYNGVDIKITDKQFLHSFIIDINNPLNIEFYKFVSYYCNCHSLQNNNKLSLLKLKISNELLLLKIINDAPLEKQFDNFTISYRKFLHMARLSGIFYGYYKPTVENKLEYYVNEQIHNTYDWCCENYGYIVSPHFNITLDKYFNTIDKPNYIQIYYFKQFLKYFDDSIKRFHKNSNHIISNLKPHNILIKTKLIDGYSIPISFGIYKFDQFRNLNVNYFNYVNNYPIDDEFLKFIDVSYRDFKNNQRIIDTAVSDRLYVIFVRL